ncbi:MAG TPA: DNA recombination protein RmuC [Caulobacteraceae bacterium]
MNILVILALAAALACAFGFAWAFSSMRREAARALSAEAELQQARDRMIRAEARAEAAETAKSQVGDSIRAASLEAAERAAAALLSRADEKFKAQDAVAKAALETTLAPVKETLTRFEAQVTAMEQARAADTGGLKAQIEGLMQASALTQNEARRLTEALKRGSGVRGRWGEQTLRNVLEAAGMAGRFDFAEQVTTDDGRQRPDVVVRMPGGGNFVIDAKAPLADYLAAQEAVDDAGRDASLQLHAESVRRHVNDLSKRAYWEQFERSPDFVALFIPGDSFLCAALDRMPDLMTEALAKRVVLVTPTTLFGLLKAVAYGWRAEEQAKNAADVAELGKVLYQRLSVMGGHVAAMGKALENATGKYNQFVGSLETQVLTQARKFEDLQVDHAGKELPELTALEATPRQLIKLAAGE